MKKLLSYFLQGLLYLAPVAVTFYIIYLIFTFTDGLLQDVLEAVFGTKIPGLGLLTIILILILVGYLGQTFIARPLKNVFIGLVKRVPLLNFIYSAMQDLFSAFVGKEKKFGKPVLVNVNPITNLDRLGFVTEDDLSLLGLDDKVAVYFPDSYNFAGELFIVPASQVKPVDINAGEVMKFIVSGGATGWNSHHLN